MQLQWKVSLSATCLHTVACFQEGLAIADAELATVLGGPVEQLLGEVSTCGLQSEEFLSQLVMLASTVDHNRQLVEQALTRVAGKAAVQENTVSRLAGAVSDLEAALLRQRPELVDELDVRSRPLREQWEARGPGLLRQMARLTEDQLLTPAAEVVLVAPIVGGHGRAHLPGNRVTFEAVLANPHAHLPETLRLGWLLSQVNLDVPMFSERILRARLPIVAQLATLPLVLAAAETVELSRLDDDMLLSALHCWHLPADLPADVVDRLQAWWETYQSSDSRWPVALTALDAMLMT